MIKGRINQNQENIVQEEQGKKFRFHPYYYMARKGIYSTKEGERYQIKMVKFQKHDDKLELQFQERKKFGKKFKLESNWEHIDFDYYQITNSNENWILKFSKK